MTHKPCHFTIIHFTQKWCLWQIRTVKGTELGTKDTNCKSKNTARLLKMSIWVKQMLM